MRSDRERLLDIRDAIERIHRHVSRGKDVFEKDELVQTWVVHHLQIIGEAVHRLSTDLKVKHPEVPWTKIVGMRHVLVHDYFGIDLVRVWAVVERDLPVLRGQIDGLLAEVNS